MLQYLDPVPFTIDNDSHLGLSETQGLLSSDGENLIIEFRIADTVIGVVKTPSKHLRVPIAELQSISYQKRNLGFSGAVVLQTRSQHVLEALPESRMGMARLLIQRRSRGTAEAFCLAMREAIVRKRGQMLQDDIAKLEQADE